jgi:hypothetical protein
MQDRFIVYGWNSGAVAELGEAISDRS